MTATAATDATLLTDSHGRLVQCDCLAHTCQKNDADRRDLRSFVRTVLTQPQRVEMLADPLGQLSAVGRL